jgi:3'(2'), 5'-bisphosphate nucleotidase
MDDQSAAAHRNEILDGFARACVEAGAAILQVYHSDFTVETKADASPVTQADALGEAIILRALTEILPGVPVIAEEQVAAGHIPEVDGMFLLVDPLDGTKEFVQRRGDFTVNIALVENHAPTLGVVYAPVERRLFAGDAARGLAWSASVDEGGAIGPHTAMRIRDLPAGGLSAVASRSHDTPETRDYLAQFDVADRVSRGSSLKICMVAEGDADLYPRLAPTCEWDIAAGDAVLRAAGGKLLAPDGSVMRYGKPGFFNPGFVAAGDIDPPPIAPFLKASTGSAD